MYRALNCTGSVFLSKDLPPQEATFASDEGRIFHDHMEVTLRDFLEHQETGKNILRKISEVVTPEMIESVNRGLEVIWEKVFEFSVTGKVWDFEEQFWLKKNLQMGGYVDFYMLYKDDHGNRVLVVGDYKYGFRHVTAKGNAQLAFYACAIREEIQKRGKDIDYVRAFIFQPRAYGKNDYEETKFTIKQLDTWKEKFFKTAEKIFIDKKATYKVGDWCEYCRAQTLCPVYQDKIGKDLSLDIVDVEAIKLPKPQQVPMAQRVRIAMAAQEITKFVSAVKADVMSSFLNGHDTPGVKVVEGKARRLWIDREKRIRKRLLKWGVKPYNEKLKGITEIEKILSLEYGRSEAKKMLEDLVQMSEPPLVLVPEKDERKAVKTVLDNIEGLNNE